MEKKFTLIEALVVVAIIGILVSILMPSLMKSRELAYQAVCASNQKQIGVAVFSYLNGNDERFHQRQNHQRWVNESTGVTLATTDSYAYWGIAYGYYMTESNPAKSRFVFKCPKVKEVDPWVDFEINGQYTSYGFNGVSSWGARELFKSDQSGEHLANVDNPVNTIITHDSYESMVEGNDTIPGGLAQWPDKWQEYERHLNKTNVMWVDGHVSYLIRGAWRPGLYYGL